ncbi:MAG: hypothetical protein ACJ757_10380 [Gaiellaceae bacterium]
MRNLSERVSLRRGEQAIFEDAVEKLEIATIRAVARGGGRRQSIE